MAAIVMTALVGGLGARYYIVAIAARYRNQQ
jgi:hypothetical protein